MTHALGIAPHTGWAACVVVAGTPRKPQIVANQVVDILGDDERWLVGPPRKPYPSRVVSPADLVSLYAK